MLDFDNELFLEIAELVDIGIMSENLFEELKESKLNEEHFEELEELIESENIGKIQDLVRNAEGNDFYDLLEMYSWIEENKF
jgi:hypothetical protein